MLFESGAAGSRARDLLILIFACADKKKTKMQAKELEQKLTELMKLRFHF